MALEYFLTYLKVFVTGGVICLIGQIFINTTKATSARILVGFLLAGVVLEVVGVYKYIEKFGKAGATIPISGFGSALAKGAMKGAMEKGFLGAITGGMEAVAAGLAIVIFLAFIVGLISKPKTKN